MELSLSILINGKTQKKLQTDLLVLMKNPFTNLPNSIFKNFISESKNLRREKTMQFAEKYIDI